jgi:hypothetical protein
MSRRDRRARATGRKSEKTYGYVQMLHALLRDEGFMNLSPNAHKTLNYLCSQYQGRNNGDLDICEKNARKRGMKMSAASLRRGANELEEAGVIQKTRQGGKNRNNLYALTWREINYDARKHDYLSSVEPSMGWLPKKASSPVTQVESPVTQSAVSIHCPPKTASPMAQSVPFSLPH